MLIVLTFILQFMLASTTASCSLRACKGINAVGRHRSLVAEPASALMRRCVLTRLAMPRLVVPIAPRIQAQTLHDSVSSLFLVSNYEHIVLLVPTCILPFFSERTTTAFLWRWRTKASRSAYSCTLVSSHHLRPLLRLQHTRTDNDDPCEGREQARPTEHVLRP